MKKKVMNTVNKQQYTLETVPENIGFNQFYCYNTKNGTIFIGEILGKSATSPYFMYSINGVIYKTYNGFEGNTRTMTIERNFKCFIDYQRFVNNYTEYLTSKEKNKKTRNTKYIVDKRTFYCKKTCAVDIPYGYKEFSTKKDAETFAYNGLQKLKTSIPKCIEEFKGLKSVLENKLKFLRSDYKAKFDINLSNEYTYLYKFQATPTTIKENDILFKVNTKRCGLTLEIVEVEDDSVVSVKGFVRPDIAKLSDGTIFIEGECGYSYPLIFRYIDKDKITIKVKMSNAKYVLNIVDSAIATLESAEKHVSSYVPFGTGRFTYFNISYEKTVLKDVKKYLQTID